MATTNSSTKEVKNQEIRDLMISKNVSVEDLAKGMGLSKQTIQRRLNGKFIKYVHEAFLVSKVFEMPFNEFVIDVLHQN